MTKWKFILISSVIYNRFVSFNIIILILDNILFQWYNFFISIRGLTNVPSLFAKYQFIFIFFLHSFLSFLNIIARVLILLPVSSKRYILMKFVYIVNITIMFLIYSFEKVVFSQDIRICISLSISDYELNSFPSFTIYAISCTVLINRFIYVI